MVAVVDIEGIGEQYAAKLTAAGVTTVEALLERAGPSAGRDALAEATGIDKARILEWVNRADLMRIKGVGSEFSDLLEAAGINSVPELAQRRADLLQAKLVEVNKAKSLVRRTPTVDEVTRWVDEAKTLRQAVEHVQASKHRMTIQEAYGSVPPLQRDIDDAIRESKEERAEKLVAGMRYGNE